MNASKGVRSQIQRADPLRPAYLVSGERSGVNVERRHVDRRLAESLNRVGVEERSRIVGDACELGDRLDGADLGVRHLNGNEHRVLVDDALERGGGYEPASIRGEIAHAEALPLQALRGMQHRIVLDGAHDDVGREITRARTSTPSRSAFATPNKTASSASVAPDVNTTSSGRRAPRQRATVLRAASIASNAARPGEWREFALPPPRG